MPSIPAHSQGVLPNPDVLTLEPSLLLIKRPPALCAAVWYSRHSCYRRCLQDLPWQGLSVQRHVLVHRYRCRKLVFRARCFCERLPEVAWSHARQTDRTWEIVRTSATSPAGRAGERLLWRLAILTSDDAVLRRVERPPSESPEEKTIRNLGFDDWAWRKGQNYDTILVDLDLHRVADLLRSVE